MGYATYKWFLKHNFEEYAGQWIAIIDKKVVASGSDVQKTIAEAKQEYPTKVPFITKIKTSLSVIH